MEIEFLCPYWGQEGIDGDAFVNKVLEAGYNGAEINMPEDRSFEKAILKAVEEKSFQFVAQQWLPPANESVDEYRARLKQRLEYLISLDPLFINSHTGKDFFSFDDNCRIIEDCFELSEKHNVRIIHETHRGRFNFSAFHTLPYLEKFPELELNADFSHWCNVSESFLEDQQEAVNKAIQQSTYVHTRVGHTQSAQVTTPFAPEWKEALEIFTSWWVKMIEAQKSKGTKKLFLCPEFGPVPYMPTVPFTDMPIADQWKVNVQMMEYLKSSVIK